jgi:hypothetical protein
VTVILKFDPPCVPLADFLEVTDLLHCFSYYLSENTEKNYKQCEVIEICKVFFSFLSVLRLELRS